MAATAAVFDSIPDYTLVSALTTYVCHIYLTNAIPIFTSILLVNPMPYQLINCALTFTFHCVFCLFLLLSPFHYYYIIFVQSRSFFPLSLPFFFFFTFLSLSLLLLLVLFSLSLFSLFILIQSMVLYYYYIYIFCGYCMSSSPLQIILN